MHISFRPRPTVCSRSIRFVLAVGVVALGACARGDQPRLSEDYAGDAQCLSCHLAMETHLETAHHRTSRPASSDAIAGSFDVGDNVLATSNPYVRFRMDSTDTGFYQTAVMGQPPRVTQRSERFDVVIGSGRKGQSYLYWQGDQLFQLPVSYWTELGAWVNSPGFRDGAANFDRAIAPRCLECHATWFASEPDTSVNNRYDRDAFILTISCERCHGPGADHVALRRSSAPSRGASEIVNPARLPRDRQIDVCALCHGGIGESNAPSFTFVAGRPLDEYLVLREGTPGQMLDVHGNQVGLLARSRCFQESTMTCSTCHDVHSVQREPATFAPSCLGCHQVQSCGLFPRRGTAIAGRCVECHMPDLTSNTIISTHEGGQLRPRVRTHWITVYPEVEPR